MVPNGLSYLRHFLKPSLFQVIYHITYACNAHCPFCIHHSYLNARTNQELSLEELDKILPHFPSFPWLLLSGGEPFLRGDISKIIEMFHRHCKVAHVTITSNGMFCDRVTACIQDVFSRIPDITLNFSFSIDAIGEDHDRIRATPNNYRMTLETIRAVKELRSQHPGLSLKAHTVLTRENFNQFDQITDAIYELGMDLHTFDFVRPTPGNASQDLHALTVQEVSGMVAKIHENNKRYKGYQNLGLHSALIYKVSQAVMEHNYDLYPKFMTEKTQVIPCQAPERNLIMNPYGDVGFCELRDFIGNLRQFDYNLETLLTSETAKQLADSIHRKECYCFHPCYQQVNVLFSKPELIKAFLDKP